MIKKYLKREEGQGLVEYALILVLVAIVVIAILMQLGPELNRVFGRITAVLQGSGVIISDGAITSISAKTSTSGGLGGTTTDVVVTVTVSQDTKVTATTDKGLTGSNNCSAGTPCNITITNAPGTGTIVAKDDIGGEGVTVNY